jgi:small subunit ribosomal protein S20
MANRHLSAIKRARQNIKLNEHNTTLRSALRTAVKKVVTAVEKGDVTTAKMELPLAVRALGKAKTKGIIHSNQAARKISRLTRKVARLGVAPS